MAQLLEGWLTLIHDSFRSQKMFLKADFKLMVKKSPSQNLGAKIVWKNLFCLVINPNHYPGLPKFGFEQLGLCTNKVLRISQQKNEKDPSKKKNARKDYSGGCIFPGFFAVLPSFILCQFCCCCCWWWRCFLFLLLLLASYLVSLLFHFI